MAKKVLSLIRELTNSQWAQFLKRAQATYQKADEITHEGGCIAMAHAAKHHDARRMLDMYQIMGQSTRRKGFLVWVEMFSPIRITDGKKGMAVKLLRPGDQGYVPFDLEGAQARPFWTLEEAEEKTPTKLSTEGFIKMITSYQGKIAKAKKGERFQIEGNVTELETLVQSTLADAQRRKVALATPAPTPVQPVQPVLVPSPETSHLNGTLPAVIEQVAEQHITV